MSRLRTVFYNDPPLEGDVATTDKDGLARDFVGAADTRSLDHFSGPCRSFIGIRVAEACHDGLLPAAGIKPSGNPNTLFQITPVTHFNIQGTAILAEYVCRSNSYASCLNGTAL